MARKKARHLDAVRVLPEVIRRLLAVQDPDDLLPEVLSLCRNYLAADEVSMLLLGEEPRLLVEHTVVGTKLRPTRHRVRVGREGVTGWVAARRKPQVVRDVRRDKRYVQADPKRRSEAAVPILSGDRLLGVLNFESNRVGYFQKSDLPLLEFLAAQIAIAVRVAELREREEGMRDRLAMLHHLSRLSGGFMPAEQYLQRVTDVTRRTIGCFYTAVIQGDYERETLCVLAQSSLEPVEVKVGETIKFGQGLIGKSFELGEIVHVRNVSKESIYLDKVPGVKSEVCIPIRVGDHCLGILDAQSQKLDGFSADDLMVLETMARFLVPVLQTAKEPA